MKQLTCAALIALAPIALPMAAMAEGQTHHVAIHVDEGDPPLMNMALNNAQNVAAYYASQGDKVVIELVAYGPGLAILLEGSPMKDRIAMMSLELDDISFSACANTMAAMEKKLGHKMTLLDEAEVVPSGVVRLIELQEQGYAYVRP
ncbi:DsrE family protein [Frigidibacter sp. ROC022]|uniref:DsrE family protein n=1 Tax=Frigidibacter sp. ROC022 TaxID=2971796 RepID=UPI00215A626D|nr:DsrE family protein [Frigidibacter sp. ROC022]MCR8723664.1 DsrE family protein [Frigidibacter sp. ROC022]